MRATVLENPCVSEGHYCLVLRLPSPQSRPQPGQFYMIQVGEGWDPLLPRPFSVYRVLAPDRLAFLYRVVGRGTAWMAHLAPGDTVELRGPLGNAFPPPPSDVEEVLLVGGGIGVAPLVLWAEELRTRHPGLSVVALVGGRRASDVLCVEEFRQMGIWVVEATNDGSRGVQGYVTEALAWYLDQEPRRRRVVYACGPHPMLVRMVELLEPLGVPAWFSLEAWMACGFGLCMGCAVEAREGGYPLVCVDGPIFPAQALKWEMAVERRGR